jgi:predicted nuclease of predicted toxin-antitoxin system
MAMPAVYLDECIDRRLADRLRALGVDLETVAEAAAAGSSDEAQLVYASSRGRVLLSQNQIDFRRLHAAFVRAGRPHGGIAIVPQTVPLERLERRVRLLLDWIGTFPDPRSRLFAWTELQQRAIHGFRLPGWEESVVRDALGWA